MWLKQELNRKCMFVYGEEARAHLPDRDLLRFGFLVLFARHRAACERTHALATVNDNEWVFRRCISNDDNELQSTAWHRRWFRCLWLLVYKLWTRLGNVHRSSSDVANWKKKRGALCALAHVLRNCDAMSRIRPHIKLNHWPPIRSYKSWQKNTKNQPSAWPRCEMFDAFFNDPSHFSGNDGDIRNITHLKLNESLAFFSFWLFLFKYRTESIFFALIRPNARKMRLHMYRTLPRKVKALKILVFCRVMHKWYLMFCVCVWK